jgi:hypothetical protein
VFSEGRACCPSNGERILRLSPSPISRSQRRVCHDIMEDVVSWPLRSPRTAASFVPLESGSMFGILIPLGRRALGEKCLAEQTPEIRNPSEVEGCHAILVEHATRSRAEPVLVLTKGSSGRAPLLFAD